MNLYLKWETLLFGVPGEGAGGGDVFCEVSEDGAAPPS